MRTLNELIRPSILRLKPYSSARDEYKGEASVFLDANENPYNAPYNRYPDPMQWVLKKKIGTLKGIEASRILLGNGSDEPIDLLYRAFCEPTIDNAVAIDPSYGMYRVCADINNVDYRTVQLAENFALESDKLLAATDAHTKLIFLCSPNNPSGNSLSIDEVKRVLEGFDGITVIDEAYIDFATQASAINLLESYPKLVILQTFSKAWGSAAIRLGMAFASKEIIEVLSKIKYPYNINQLTQEHALQLIEKAPQISRWVEELKQQRTLLSQQLRKATSVKIVYPSDANFVLAKVENANSLYTYLVETGIIVRNRHNITLCDDCLRITVGTPQENKQLIEALNTYSA